MPQDCGALYPAWVNPTHGNDTTGQVGNRSLPFKTLQLAIDRVQAHIMANAPVVFPVTEYGQGIVYAMPGLYGSHFVGTTEMGSGDVLPIRMKDRVHVQGLGARRCIIRGDNVDDNASIFRPCILSSATPTIASGELLVSYTNSSQYEGFLAPDGTVHPLPWACTGETAEALDGFTFQGGDVQVAFENEAGAGFPDDKDRISYPLSGRVSNCLFDMRHCIDPEVIGLPNISGPTIGILVAPRFMGPSITGSTAKFGYPEMKVHILNNTFVMWDGDMTTAAIQPAVAIVDVTNPFGAGLPPYVDDWDPQLGIPELALRGLSNLGIQNNLIRTRPDSFEGGALRYAATLGIGESDMLVSNAGFGNSFTTNAFAIGRIAAVMATGPSGPQGTGDCTITGSWGAQCPVPPSLGSLGSIPRLRAATPTGDFNPYPGFGPGCAFNLYYNSGDPDPAPVPALPLYNGGTTSGEFDPVFVGESLIAVGASVQTNYRDFRLLPGSPAQDLGRVFVVNRFTNGATYRESSCPGVQFMDWDGEGYGNPRVVGLVDIGFDEVQLFTMAGSYANHDNSHNNPPRNSSGVPVLNQAVGIGQICRFALFPRLVPGVSPSIDLFQSSASFALLATERPALQSQYATGWINPPATLGAPSDHTAVNTPPPFHLQWIDDMSMPLPIQQSWSTIFSFATTKQRTFFGSTNQTQVSFLLTEIMPQNCYKDDDEGANYASWFNTQFKVTVPSLPDNKVFYSNLQVEYR